MAVVATKERRGILCRRIHCYMYTHATFYTRRGVQYISNGACCGLPYCPSLHTELRLVLCIVEDVKVYTQIQRTIITRNTVKIIIINNV